MKIFDPHITGSLSVSASANIQGDLIVSGTIYGTAQISGEVQDAVSASHAASYLLTSSFENYTGSVATTGSNTFIGDQTISGSLLPQGTLTHDLGSDTQRWRDIYLAGNTINLGGTKITKDTDGNVEVKDSNNTLKKIVASEIEVGTGNSKKVIKVSNGKLKLFDKDDTKEESAALSGSFTGSFVGDGSRLTNVPASAVQGLSLNKIADGAVTASIGNGKMTLNANFEPDLTDTRDLGSPTKQWRDLFLSSGSLYINGQQVLSTTGNELRVTTDEGESIKILETGSDTITLQTENGDITLTSSGNGNIELDAPIQIGAGNKILSSDGNSIQFGNGLIVTGSIVLSGTVDGVDIADLKSDVDAILAGSSADKDSFAEIVSLINSVDTTNDQAFASHYTASNNRLDSLETISSSHDGRLDALEVKSGSVDTLNTTQNSRLSSLETKTGSLDSDISTLDGRLDSLETESGSIRSQFNSYTASNDDTNSTQGGRLDSIESFTASIDDTYATDTDVTNLRGTFNSYTSSNDTTNTQQDGRLSSLETFTGSLDATYASDQDVSDLRGDLNTYTSSTDLTIGNQANDISTLDGRVDSLETKTGSLDSTNTTQNSRLSSLETTSGSHDSRLGTIESTNSTQNNRLTTLESTTTTHDGRLDSLETKTGSLDSTNTTQNARLGSLESFTASIDDDFATDQDVTDLRTDLNTYTASNDSTNTTQNSRLSSIETKTGSLDSDISVLDGRIDSLETKSGSLDSDIKTKLNTENVVSGSEFVLNETSPIIQYVDVTVTQSGGLYYIDGVQQQKLSLSRGLIYRFDVSDSSLSGHPFRFSTDDQHLSQHTNGVTVSGTEGNSGAYVQIIVDHSTPQTLYYYCTNHNGMGNVAFVGGAGDTDSVTEGSSNLYYTDARVKTKLNTENVISGSEQVTISDTTGYSGVNTRITNLETFETKVDSGLEFTGSNVTIKGDLLVKGTETRVNSNTVEIGDNIISLNGSGAVNAGIEVRDNESPGVQSGSLIYDTGDNVWKAGIKGSEERILLNNDLTTLDGRLDSIESFTSSVDNTYATDADVSNLRGDFNTYTSSTDSDISSVQSVNTTQDGRLGSLETKTGSLDSDISTLDGRVDSLESYTASLDETYATDEDVTDLRNDLNLYTSSNDSTNTTQNGRLSSLETKSGSVDSTLTTLDGRLDSIETKTGSLESTDTTQNNRLDSLESFTGSIDTTYATDQDVSDLRGEFNSYTSSTDSDITSIESVNTTQNNRLDSIEVRTGSLVSDVTTIGGRVDSIETKTGSLDSDISTLDGRVDSIESKTGSLDGDISNLDGRIDSLENKTGSLNTDISNINGRIDSIETKTGSLDSDISTLDGRVDSIETKTGSLDSDISTLDGRIDSLETESGSIRSTFNSYTSSNDSTNTSQNNRLDSLESASGSYLTSHPTINSANSSNNSGRTYIQDILLDGNGHVTGLTTGTETVVNTDEYVTGATWNGSTAVLEFTRNDGDTFNVTMLETLSDVTVTGGTYNSGTQTLTLTKNDGNTISVSGFAIDTDVNYFTTGATFNTVDGVLTLSVKGSNDVTVDLDGRYSLTSHNHDGAYVNVSGDTMSGTLTASGGINGLTQSNGISGNNFNITGVNAITINDPGEGIVWSNGSSGNIVLATIDDSTDNILNLTGTGATLAVNGATVATQSWVTSNPTHPSVSAASSSNNGGRTYIQDILLDSYGHITGLTTATETVVNTDQYTTGVTFDTSNGVLTFTRNSGNTYTVDLDNRYLTSYIESDTLDSVADRGNTTNQSLNIGDYISMSSTQPKVRLYESDTTDKNKELLVSGGGFYIRNLNDNGSAGINLINISNSGNLNVTGTISASGYNDSNWNTAYGWGDHSQAGYLTSYNNEYTTGATFSTSTGVITFTRNDGDTFSVDIDGRFLTSFTETDPIFVASPAYNITSSNITNWNTAYGWGDHSQQGYLTSHPSVSAATSSNNSGRTYIQDILLDSFGHITGITTGTETVTNTDTNYYVTGATFNTSNGVITITRNDGSTVTVDIDGKYAESGHNHDSAYVNVGGDTMTGTLTVPTVQFGSATLAKSGDNNHIHFNGTAIIPNTTTTSSNAAMGTSAYRWSTVYGGYGNFSNSVTANAFAKIGGTSSQFLKADGSVDSNTYLTSHPSVSAASSSNNSGRTYIQDILLDSFGHITGITTATETVTNTDEYTTGATFNSSSGIITFTRNDGDSYTLDISDTLSEITVTGGTYNSSTQTLTLTKSDGNSIDVSGFAVDTDINYYTTGATFNTGNGIITGTRNDGGTWTVDLDGRYLTSYTETDTLDSVADRGNSTNQYLQAAYFQSTGSQLLRRYSSGWTYTTHDVVYNGWSSSTGDYTYLKSAGNSSGGHGIIAVGDNGFWIGRTDLETGALTDSATNPIGYTLLRSDSSGNVTISGTITASGYNKSNWDTAYGWGDHSMQGYLTSHPTIAGVSSNNSGRTYIQDILTDSNGHVTGITTGTETVVNTDTNYYTTGATFNTGNGIITGTRNDGGTWTVDIDGRYLTSYTESSTLADVVSRGNYFGNSQSGFVTNNTWGSEFRRIKRITFTSGGSNWDTDNHGIFSTDASGNYNDSMSLNSFNDLTLRVDTNSNNASSYVRFMQHSTGAGTEWFRSGYDGGQYVNLFRQSGYVAFEGLDFAISNSNSDHGFANYFRGSNTHLVIGTGGTLYLNYGQSSGTIRMYGDLMLNDTTIVSSSRVLQNVTGNISMFTNDSGYLTSHPTIAGVSSNNSGRTYIQDVLTDSNGHVTGLTTATETVTNTDTNYYASSFSWNSGNGVLTLNRSGLSSISVDLDGRYAEYDHQTSTNSDFNNVRTSGIYTLDYGGQANANSPDGLAWHALWHARSGGTRQAQITIPYSQDNIYFRRANNSTAESWYDWVKIWHEGNDGSGSGLDADVLDGQQGSYYLDYNNFTNKPTIGNGTMTISAGGGMSGGGSFTANQTGNSSVTISHADTSSASSSNNSGRTYIQDVLIDTYGHVTGLTVATETVTNTDTNYYTTGATFNTGNGIITGTRNDGGTWTVDIDNRYLPYGGGTITGDLQVNGHIRGGGQQLVLNAGESHSYATGQTNEYIYLNAEQGLEINSETGNWSGGWAARKTAYLRGDQLTLDGETLTKTNIQNFKTAYGWGNHASAGYVTHDYFTTGATFNSGNGIATFTRSDGNTYTLNLLSTLSDVTVTGGTYNSGNQTLTLTKSNGTTVSVSGFAVDTDVNWYTTGATFNTGNGIITGTRNDGGTWTVDIDGRYLPLGGGTLTGTVSLGELRIGEHAVHGGYWGLWNSQASSTDTQQYMIISAGTDTYVNGDNVYIRAGNNANSNELKVTTGGSYIGGNKIATESWVTSNPTHPSVSAAGSSNNGGRTYIQDIFLDSYGHITGITTATETVTNTDTNDIDYINSASFNTGNGILTLSGVGNASATVDLDGRYLQSESDTLATVVSRGNSTDGVIRFTGNGTDTGIRFNNSVVANDAAGIRQNGTSNAGELEFFTTDDDNEPFVFRHYTTGQDGSGSSVEWFRIGAAGDITAARHVYASGGNSTQWNSAYTYSQVGHLPLAGGTMSGGINMGNNNLTNVNHIQIGDPGAGEGIEWSGGNGFKIYESPNNLTNASGNLQFVVGSTRILTLGSNGQSEFTDKLTLTSSTSGSTIFDIQGTSGQLFSITDDLTGDLFAVSDASGVPIFNVNASGAITMDTLSSFYVGDNKVINGSGNIEFDGPVTTTNQGRGIYWTGYDKEGTTDLSDSAHILHTTNSGGLSGSVIEIKSHNDAADGVNFVTNSNDGVRINGNIIVNAGNINNYHKSVSAATSSDNSGRTYIQDVLLDSHGHVTGLTTASESVTNTDRYVNSASFNTSDGVLTLTRAGSDTNTVTVDLDGRYAYSSHDHNRITENATITFGASQLQWMDQSGTGGTGLNGQAPQNPNNDWHHQIIMNHANGNGYYVQMAFDFHDDQVWFQRMENGSLEGWREFIHSGNIGSQSVNYATSAGSAATATNADSADRIDGVAFRNTGSNSGINADSLNSNGVTYYTGGVTNFSGNSTDGALYSQAYSSSWQHQIAGDYRSGRIAVRGKNNNTWQSWRKVPNVNSTTFTNTNGVTFTHDLGTDHVIVQVYDANGDLFFPSRVNVQGGNVEVNFETNRTGRLVVIG